MNPERLDPRLLATLAAVAETGSFSAAAEARHLTQPAVSQQIAMLERQVGASVLHRRPLRLTATGEVLLAAAGRIRAALTAADQDLRALQEGDGGSITVASFNSAAAGPVPAALAAFHEERPGVAIGLSQMEPRDAYPALVRGDVDLAVTYRYPQSQKKIPPDVHVELVGVDEFVAVVPVDHPLARRASLTLHEAAHAGLIGTPLSEVPLPWPGGAQPQDVHGVRFAGEDYATTLQLVSHGLGVALVPELVTRHQPSGVRVVPLEGRPWHRRIMVASLASGRANEALRAMTRHLTAALSRPA